MAIIGAIIGDIIGSQYEFGRPDDLDWKTCPLFTDKCKFTDDTIMTIAAKEAMLTDFDFAKAYRKWGNKYPSSYGAMFWGWLRDPTMGAYGSYGNGSAMRVSAIPDFIPGDFYDITEYAIKSAECTHNDPEGIKGAVVTAICIGGIKYKNWSKDRVLQYIASEYPKNEYIYAPEISLAEYRDSYKWDVTCQGSVPVAFRCFYESDNYKSFIRNVLSLKCDTDTLGAIGGGMAEEFYNGTGFHEKAVLRRYLTLELYNAVYYNKF